MSRQFSILFAGAALALCATAGAAAYAEQAAPAPRTQSQTIVRTDTDGVTHEVRVIRDASGKVTVTRDGKTTVVDPHEAMAMAMRHHRDPAEHLRNALQLRPNQEAALTAYLAALHPQHSAMMLHADDHDGPKTTPERLADMEKMLAEHDAMVRAHIAATRTFYNQLDAGQKKAFDEMEGAGHMGMMQQIRFVHAVPGMPPMPPMPLPPVPPTPPSF
ncbi:Spy/CpxP family protein refolding chaperone [Phenylobacterium sp.]|uniref:Spy/CpxP family protein refolding chaperone n=1 Tax=Phenylobacterium sp. TaxID=1871053 RepID=UPI002DF4FF84|nr:Spy/CpxP family protein refolding chaperone [Phenylobacterium sp.]